MRNPISKVETGFANALVHNWVPAMRERKVAKVIPLTQKEGGLGGRGWRKTKEFLWSTPFPLLIRKPLFSDRPIARARQRERGETTFPLTKNAKSMIHEWFFLRRGYSSRSHLTWRTCPSSCGLSGKYSLVALQARYFPLSSAMGMKRRKAVVEDTPPSPPPSPPSPSLCSTVMWVPRVSSSRPPTNQRKMGMGREPGRKRFHVNRQKIGVVDKSHFEKQWPFTQKKPNKEELRKKFVSNRQKPSGCLICCPGKNPKSNAFSFSSFSPKRERYTTKAAASSNFLDCTQDFCREKVKSLRVNTVNFVEEGKLQKKTFC